MTQGQRHQGHPKWFSKHRPLVPKPYEPSERQDSGVELSPGRILCRGFGSSFSLSRAACYARALMKDGFHFCFFFVGLPFPMFLAYNNVGLQFLLAIKSMFGQQLACAIHSLYWRCWRTTSDGQQPTAIIFINFTQKGIYVAGRVGGPGCPFGH